MSNDTACSSSLVSAHQAHKGLLAGETVAAVAAGVNTMLLPITTTSIAGLGALSPDARCKTFDASADGYGRGEGFGVVVLAPTAGASGKQQGNTVLALVCGSAVNQDGRSSGLTAPNGPSQTALVRDVLASGALSGADVGYVATHGTGWRAADAEHALQEWSGVEWSEHSAGRFLHWREREFSCGCHDPLDTPPLTCSHLAACRHAAGRPH